MNEEEFNYKEYEQRLLRDDIVLQEVIKANEMGRKIKYSEEQVLEAQAENGKQEINGMFRKMVNPMENNLISFVFNCFSLISFPLVYFNTDISSTIVACLGLLELVIMMIIM